MNSVFRFLAALTFGGILQAQPDIEAFSPASVKLPELAVPASIRHLNISDPKVRMIVRVGIQGEVVDFIFTEADHEALLRLAERGFKRAIFKAATRNGAALVSDLELEIHFLQPNKLTGGVVGMSSHDHIAETIAGISETRPALVASKVRELDRSLTLAIRGETMIPVDERDVPLAGRAVIEFWVDTDGKTHLARVVSSDHPAISKAALFMLRGSQFEPPTRSNRPTVVKVRLPFDFG